jgi:hypothetical protein
MLDLDIKLPVRAWTDSSAALGIASRSGLGKLRHLETHTLWLQEKVRTGAIMVKKVRGEVNPADIFTKHLPSREQVHQLLDLFGCEYRQGRAESAPLLRPHGYDDREGGHSGHDPLPTFIADFDAEIHDLNVLPHMHSKADVEKLFPTITAAAATENVEDFDCDAVVGSGGRGPNRELEGPSFVRSDKGKAALALETRTGSGSRGCRVRSDGTTTRRRGDGPQMQPSCPAP